MPQGATENRSLPIGGRGSNPDPRRLIEGILHFCVLVPAPAVLLLDISNQLVQVAGQGRTTDAGSIEQLKRVAAVVDCQVIDVTDRRPMGSRQFLEDWQTTPGSTPAPAMLLLRYSSIRWARAGDATAQQAVMITAKPVAAQYGRTIRKSWLLNWMLLRS